MVEIILSVAAIAVIFGLGVIVNALRHARAGGVAQTDELMKSGVSLNRLRHGDLRKTDSGSTVTVRKGMKMTRTQDGKREVTPTRTISRDLY